MQIGVELVVPNYNFNEFSIKNKLIFGPVPIHVSIWNMGHLCFENLFLFLDEKKQQNNYVIQNHVPDSPNRNVPLLV
jgi:hypothetical protein